MSEKDLFLPVKEWLVERNWDVYAEVSGVGGRADVIGRQGKVMLNVELKKQLSFDLLDQAMSRKNYFQYIYIAIPKRKTSLPRVVRDLLKREGIGLLMIDQGFCKMQVHARFNRPPYYDNIEWRYLLKKEYESHIGGDNGSHILTPYKLLMKQIRNYLVTVKDADSIRAVHGGYRNYGWVSIDDILEHCEADYHYASPKPSVSNALRNFEMDWCEVKKEKGRLYYRAKNETQRISRMTD